MTDQVVRAAFHRHVLKKAHECTDTFVVDELSLKNGLVRADIAVLNGQLVGYEIKTEKDNLKRLANQILVYNEVFDKAFIIVSEKHLIKASELLPDWWGIYIIRSKPNEKIHFKCARKAKINKIKSSLAIAKFLWKSEAIALLHSYNGENIKQSTTKETLYNLIASTYDPTTLGQITLTYLKKRKDWRTSH